MCWLQNCLRLWLLLLIPMLLLLLLLLIFLLKIHPTLRI
jgi:hypothetical protein